MIYLLKMVMFQFAMLNNQRVTFGEQRMGIGILLSLFGVPYSLHS
jgi:hypothetical protein